MKQPSKILVAHLILGSFLLAMAACQTATAPSSPTERPNIIFILADDQRWDSVGFMGHETVETPHLDRLAAEGYTFRQAFVTSAICMPSRASIMLGQYERRHGVNFNSGVAMAPEAWAQSYPVLLREAGYFTGYIGKNHLPIGAEGYYTGLMESSFDFWYAGHHHIGFYPKDYHAIFDNAAVDTQAEILTQGVQAFLDPDGNEAFMQNAVAFLNRRPTDRPFMLSVCLNLPHGFSTQSMAMRKEDDVLYRTAYRQWQDDLPLAPHYRARDEIDTHKLPEDVLLTDLRQRGYDWVDQPETARERMIRVMQAITGIDRMVGELRAQLEALDLAENTVLVFTSDHGLFNGEHGLGGKSLCYETNLRVPMVIYDPRNLRDPGESRNASNREPRDELVMTLDLAPTMLGMAGVAVPDTMQGRDLTPLLAGEEVAWRDAVFGENLWSTIFGNPRCETVRTADYRYIRYFRNDNRALRERTTNDMLYVVTDEIAENYRRSLTASILGETPVHEELFHITSDPYEAHNLVNDPDHAEVLDDLRARCAQMVAEARGDLEVPPATIRIGPEHTRTRYRNQD